MFFLQNICKHVNIYTNKSVYYTWCPKHLMSTLYDVVKWTKQTQQVS